MNQMPSGYTAPLNTSSTAQTKTGEIGASMFRDADNSNYYINPSGNSVVSGTISVADPTENNHVATKVYVDGLIEGVVPEITSFCNVTYILGDESVACPPNSIEIMRNYVNNVPFGLLCGVMEEPLLYDKFHSETQCNILGGDVVTVEGNIKICKFYNVQVCPNGWTQYKNWSKTRSDTISATRKSYPNNQVTCSCTTGEHITWSNTPIELCSNAIDYYGSNSFNPKYRCDSGLSNCPAGYLSSYTWSFNDVYICGRAIIEELGCY
ncbi:MAG: hypothetical protein PHU74_00985 [Candidatus Pacebacteria bacterium]|nr:hypothetical protein [Candidatus Paceibacterota bacterium]